jgi:hypothetical protein
MLTQIVHPSPRLCAFLDQLNLPLSQPQLSRHRHISSGGRSMHSVERGVRASWNTHGSAR